MVSVLFKSESLLELASVMLSTVLSHDLAEPDYPQQVLSLGAGGSQIVGEMLEINQNFTNSIPEPVPIVVDTIGRTVYWYVRSVNLIYSRSLQSGPQEVRMWGN